jgi:hypothetical protein
MPAENFSGMQEYWIKAMDSDLLGRDLPRMGVELNAIPAMSTEAERIFSGYERSFPVVSSLRLTHNSLLVAVDTRLPISERRSATMSSKRLNVSSPGHARSLHMVRAQRSILPNVCCAIWKHGQRRWNDRWFLSGANCVLRRWNDRWCLGGANFVLVKTDRWRRRRRARRAPATCHVYFANPAPVGTWMAV